MLVILALVASLSLLTSAALYYIFVYNSLMRLLHNIDKSRENIDVLLKQRHNEILGLIKACEVYMKYEQEALEGVNVARDACIRAQGIEESGRHERELGQALKNLFALTEGYPGLKADENFLKLQQRISYLEGEIANRRELYNDSVNNYNIKISQIPDLWVARSIGMAQKEFSI
jgi:LemA protein